MKIFLMFVLAFIAVSQTVNALKCYQCGTHDGADVCSANKKKWEEKSCDEDQKCLKVEGEKDDGTPILYRTCASAKGKKDDCEDKEENRMKGTVCYCSNEDLCNGAFKADASIAGATLVVALSLFLLN